MHLATSTNFVVSDMWEFGLCHGLRDEAKLRWPHAGLLELRIISPFG